MSALFRARFPPNIHYMMSNLYFFLGCVFILGEGLAILNYPRNKQGQVRVQGARNWLLESRSRPLREGNMVDRLAANCPSTE